MQITSRKGGRSKLIQNQKKMEVKDSNGNILNAGDAVSLIKSLKVKGLSTDIKRG